MLLHRDLLQYLRKDRVVCELYRASSNAGIDAYLTGGFLRDLFISFLYKQSNLTEALTRQGLSYFSTIFEYDITIDGNPYRFSLEIIKEAKGSFFSLDRTREIYRVLAYPEAMTIKPSPFGEVALYQRGIQIDISRLSGANILEDLEGRDFTINAMAIPVKEIFCDESVELIDPYKGWDDIEKRRLKAVTRNVFEDDPVRLLRAIRLSSVTGFQIEAQTERWIKDCSYIIKKQSAERIREELFNIFSSSQSWQSIKRLNSLGLLKEILPLPDDVEMSLATLKATDRLLLRLKTDFRSLYNFLKNHLLNPIGGLPRYFFFKFAALLHDTILRVESGEWKGDKRLVTPLYPPPTSPHEGGRIKVGGDQTGEEVKNIFLLLGERLKLSKKGVRLLTTLLLNHHEAILCPLPVFPHKGGRIKVEGRLKKGERSERSMASFFREFGEDGVDIALFILIDPATYKDEDLILHIKGFLNYYFKNFLKKPLPTLLNGEEIMEIFGILPGKKVGKMLKTLNLAEREEKIKSKEEAIEFLRKEYQGLTIED